MTAGPWTLTNNTRTYLAEAGYGNLTTASAVKVALFVSTGNIGASSTTYAAATGEVAAANGYTTGGVAATLVPTGTTSVALTFSANITWTASGGSLAAYWGVLYAVTGGDILAYFLLDNTPATVTVTSGNTLTISNSNPVVTIA